MKRKFLQPFRLRGFAPGKSNDPITLLEILKSETKRISNEDIDRDFDVWMISCSTAYEAFLLRPDHLTDVNAFVRLFKRPAPGSLQEILTNRLSASLSSELAESASVSSQLIYRVADEINFIISHERFLFPDEVLISIKLEQNVTDLLNKKYTGLNFLGINRILLETAFPKLIIKVKDTLPGVYAWIHDHPKKALCISGGGIRSATFGLGVLQGLARHGLLAEFDYLSTVSGGGYVGSWLSAWIARDGSASNVFQTLDKYADKTPVKPEPEQIRHLREFSNYLTPRLGLLSADTWTLVGTYLRNLLLNWIIFIPALTTFLLIPRLNVGLLRLQVSFWGLCAIGIVGIIGAIWAIVYAALHRPSIWKPPEVGGKMDTKAGTQIRFLWFCFLPLWISATCFTTLWVWLQNSPSGLAFHGMTAKTPPTWLTFMLLGALIHCGAWCIYWFKLPKNKFIELLSVMVTGAFGGFLIWLGSKIGFSYLSFAPNLEWYVCLAVPYYLIAFGGTATIFIGLTSRLTNDSDREWWARMGAWLLIGVLGWSVFSTLVLFGPEVLCYLPHLYVSLGGISTIITLLFSYSANTPAETSKDRAAGIQARLTKIGLAVAAPLFIACLISGLSLATVCVFKSMQYPTLGGAVTFRTYDITDLPAFASDLKQHSTKLSLLVWTNLSQVSQHKLLANVDNDNAESKSLRKSLIHDLNQMVTKRVYDVAIFNDVTLSSNTEIMGSYRLNLTGQRLMRFNRLLLEDSFPESIAKNDFDSIMITHWTRIYSVIFVFIILWAIAWVLSRFININKFSLYAVYRNRIIRAYLGASNPDRRPNPFSGFDPDDNIRMCELFSKPFHVINMTLNLVEGDDMAWQQRKAESFTASPLHAGNYRLGYRKVEEYASHQSLVSFLGEPEEGNYDTGDTEILKSRLAKDGKQTHGLTLGAAVTISGAAASPNSGYHSSPIIAAIMTLFNIRLGAWLGNPGFAGNKTFTHRAPRSAVWHVVKEALGMTDDKADYVYLSDGGHFENLGLYEMVLRRNHFIVLSDAGCDPDCALEDLGNAIRKIRIDLGVPIEISQFNIASRATGKESKYCAIGTIDYSHVDGAGVEPGILIYIKPAIAGNEPRDVFNYKETSVLFPHEPTSDQWFSESQFESYRILAMHIIEVMCSGSNGRWDRTDGNLLEHFKNQTSDYLNQTKKTDNGLK